MKTIVFDIDGTLADVSHRRHFVSGKRKDWKSFFEAAPNDPEIKNIADLLRHFAFPATLTPPKFSVVFVTGRPENCRAETEAWLAKHRLSLAHIWRGCPSTPWLWMRPANDMRPDEVVKREILVQLRKEGHDIWLWFDDRQKVVDAIRAEGVTVCQVAPGDFDTAPSPYGHVEPGTLYMMVGPSGAGKTRYLTFKAFDAEIPRGAVFSSDNIREQMTGDFKDQTQNDRVFSYINAAAKARLHHGLDTWIDATHLRRADRMASVKTQVPGGPIEYLVVDRPLPEKLQDGGWRLDVKFEDGTNLVERHHKRFHSGLKDILAGDGLPNVTVRDLRILD